MHADLRLAGLDDAAALQLLTELDAESLGRYDGPIDDFVLTFETVPDPPAAAGLYRAAGYEEIPEFGPYVASEIGLCMGKVLNRSDEDGEQEAGMCQWTR